jgi:hypothetical protein
MVDCNILVHNTLNTFHLNARWEKYPAEKWFSGKQLNSKKESGASSESCDIIKLRENP